MFRKCLLSFSSLMLATILPCQIHALEDYAELCLSNAYRNDELKDRITQFIPPPYLVGFDEQIIKHLNIYQFGLKGRVCFCDWLLRFEGDYSWCWDGDYTDRQVKQLLPPSTSKTHGKIKQGTFSDLSIGGGYLFPLNCVFSLGPTFGWCYDFQELKVEEVETNDIPNVPLDGLKYTNKWQGPWVGLEASWRCSEFTIYGGWEYHWGEFRAKFQLPGPDQMGGFFSDRRKSNDVTGNLFFLDARWNLSDSWSMGVGLETLKYKAWKGVRLPNSSFADLGYDATELDKLPHSVWTSFSASFDIAYTF